MSLNAVKKPLRFALFHSTRPVNSHSSNNTQLWACFMHLNEYQDQQQEVTKKRRFSLSVHIASVPLNNVHFAVLCPRMILINIRGHTANVSDQRAFRFRCGRKFAEFLKYLHRHGAASDLSYTLQNVNDAAK